MADTQNDVNWDLLLRRIKSGKCTPFLGAGSCVDVLPLSSEIAAVWAEKEGTTMHELINSLPASLLALLPVALIARMLLKALGKRDRQRVIDKARQMQKSKRPRQRGR